MNIRFFCDLCNQKIETGGAMAGQDVQCPACQGTVTVPDNSTAPVRSSHSLGVASLRMPKLSLMTILTLGMNSWILPMQETITRPDFEQKTIYKAARKYIRFLVTLAFLISLVPLIIAWLWPILALILVALPKPFFEWMGKGILTIVVSLFFSASWMLVFGVINFTAVLFHNCMSVIFDISDQLNLMRNKP
jgi:hypothetical protein